MNAEKLQEQIKQLEEQKRVAEINMHRLDAAIIAYKDVLAMISPVLVEPKEIN